MLQSCTVSTDVNLLIFIIFVPDTKTVFIFHPMIAFSEVPTSSCTLYEELGAQHRLLEDFLGTTYVNVAAAAPHIARLYTSFWKPAPGISAPHLPTHKNRIVHDLFYLTNPPCR